MREDPRSSHQPPHDGAGSGADWDALARFAAGESSPAESASVEAWLQRHPADAALVAFVRSGLQHEVAAPSVDVELALARVRARIDAERSAESLAARSAAPSPAAAPVRPSLTIAQGGAPSRSATRARGWSAPRRAGLAAAAAVVVALGVTVARQVNGTGGPDVAASDATAPARVYETRVGVRDSVLLSDGSRVVLAPGSRLVVHPSFQDTRTVELEGAAYFEVTHDDAHPFTVQTRGTEIRDIGTAFSVSTDANGMVQVAVTEGIVAMRPRSASSPAFVELHAGDRGVVQGTMDASDTVRQGSGPQVVVSRGTVTADDVAWTRGELSYRDAPLSMVQADLKRWYGLTLQVTDSTLQGRTLKMSFAGNSAAEAVNKIALALGAEAVQRGDTVTLQVPLR